MKQSRYAPYKEFYINRGVQRPDFDMDFFHFHKMYELYFLEKGTRRYFVNDNTFLVGQGSTVILGADDVHKTGSVDNTPHTRYVMNFGREHLEPLLTAFPQVNPLAVFEYQVNILTTSLKDTHKIESLFRSLWELKQEGCDQKNLALRMTYLFQLLLFLEECVKKQQEQGTKQSPVSHPTIDRAVSYIGQNYTHDLTLERIAEEVYISPSYLSRLFKQTTNLSIVEYINMVRIRAAKELLETTRLQINEIGEAVGYTTTTHFSRMFKKGTGLTPSQYSKKYGYTAATTMY